MNKRGLIKISIILIVIALIILSVLILSKYVSAAKADQSYYGNLTCEQAEDSIIWSAAASKADVDPEGKNIYYNWEMGTPCFGTKDCDVIKIETNARYIWPPDVVRTPSTGDCYVQIGNSSESVVLGEVYTEWAGIRYAAYLNKSSMAGGEIYGPDWQYGLGGNPNTLDTEGQGFNDSTILYAVRIRSVGVGGAVKAGYIADAFGIRYDWCWTPIVYDANVSFESAIYEGNVFNFTINVTNPGANTTVKLWARKIGEDWAQKGDTQYCDNCVKLRLGFPITFGSGDVGNWEFKFNATDNQSYSIEAGNSLVIGTVTDECLDASNDCKFTVENVEQGATGRPEFENPTVSPSIGGWGETFNFSVNVSYPVEGGGDINLTLTVGTADGVLDRDVRNCPYPCTTSTRFYFNVSNFTCADISTAYYNFTAVNSNGTSYSATNPFTIERDDILFEYVAGNNTVANRSENQLDTLIVRIKDTDNNTYINGTNATFTVTIDGSTPDSGTANTSNTSGDISYFFNPICTPKYAVGDQDWQATVGATETCYKGNTSEEYNLSVRGDIKLTINEPTGTDNYTQEGIISFLGSTWDDCGDSLVTTTKYSGNTSGFGFMCDNTTTIGANAFRCNYNTNITSIEGWYNVSMFANVSFHYDNSTTSTGGDLGLFYLDPLKRLASPLAIPTTEGWGYPNWNFSVIASSGDINNVYNVSLYMAQSVNPNTVCTAPTCVNQTEINCTNCVGYQMIWFRNFNYTQQGQWFYQFKMNDSLPTSTSGTEYYVTIGEDDTNITYGGVGNSSNVTRNSTSQVLRVRVYDKDRNSFNMTNPTATVTFKLIHADYPDIDDDTKILGSNVTNDSGYAQFNFSFEDCTGWVEGNQHWVAEINTSDSNYNISTTSDIENYTIELLKPGCVVEVEVTDPVYTPSEVFQYKNFTTNATITAWKDTAGYVNATLNKPIASWDIFNETRTLGNISQGEEKKVKWFVNPTTSGSYQLEVFANSSNAGNDTRNSSSFTVYKL
ncbi:MAG: hypothetical protein KKF68_02885, partial [Nanoarchaeota archaeon]|nr:hypothetical protein [Nanoarchaeota archaeon]